MERWLNTAGLVLTLVGAGVTASGVFISRQTAEGLTGAAIGSSPCMNDLLVHQSQTAVAGLVLIVLGTLLQLIAQFRK